MKLSVEIKDVLRKLKISTRSYLCVEDWVDSQNYVICTTYGTIDVVKGMYTLRDVNVRYTVGRNTTGHILPSSADRN